MSDCHDCYWLSGGQCFLEKGKLPERWVAQFIRQSPKAREDALTCAVQSGKCEAVPDEYTDWAKNLPDVEDPEEWNEELQDKLNDYVDRHRLSHTIKRIPEE